MDERANFRIVVLITRYWFELKNYSYVGFKPDLTNRFYQRSRKISSRSLYYRYIQSFKYNLENRPMSDLKRIIHADVRPHNDHRCRYNVPIIDEVAVLLIDEDKGPRDIVLNV